MASVGCPGSGNARSSSCALSEASARSDFQLAASERRTSVGKQQVSVKQVQCEQHQQFCSCTTRPTHQMQHNFVPLEPQHDQESTQVSLRRGRRESSQIVYDLFEQQGLLSPAKQLVASESLGQQQQQQHLCLSHHQCADQTPFEQHPYRGSYAAGQPASSCRPLSRGTRAPCIKTPPGWQPSSHQLDWGPQSTATHLCHAPSAQADFRQSGSFSQGHESCQASASTSNRVCLEHHFPGGASRCCGQPISYCEPNYQHYQHHHNHHVHQQQHQQQQQHRIQSRAIPEVGYATMLPPISFSSGQQSQFHRQQMASPAKTLRFLSHEHQFHHHHHLHHQHHQHHQHHPVHQDQEQQQFASHQEVEFLDEEPMEKTYHLLGSQEQEFVDATIYHESQREQLEMNDQLVEQYSDSIPCYTDLSLATTGEVDFSGSGYEQLELAADDASANYVPHISSQYDPTSEISGSIFDNQDDEAEDDDEEQEEEEEDEEEEEEEELEAGQDVKGRASPSSRTSPAVLRGAPEMRPRCAQETVDKLRELLRKRRLSGAIIKPADAPVASTSNSNQASTPKSISSSTTGLDSSSSKAKSQATTTSGNSRRSSRFINSNSGRGSLGNAKADRCSNATKQEPIYQLRNVPNRMAARTTREQKGSAAGGRSSLSETDVSDSDASSGAGGGSSGGDQSESDEPLALSRRFSLRNRIGSSGYESSENAARCATKRKNSNPIDGNKSESNSHRKRRQREMKHEAN